MGTRKGSYSNTWRGVVVDGQVWAWPTVLMDHNAAFAQSTILDNYTSRWRQWGPLDQPDFDPGASPEDRELVLEFLRKLDAI